MDGCPWPNEIVVIYFQKNPKLLKKHADLGVLNDGSLTGVRSNLLYATLRFCAMLRCHKLLDLLRMCPFVDKLCLSLEWSMSTRSAFLILFCSIATSRLAMACFCVFIVCAMRAIISCSLFEAYSSL